MDAHLDFLIQHNLKSGYDNFDPEECQEFFGKPTPSCPNNNSYAALGHHLHHSPPTHLYDLNDPFYSKVRFLQTLHSPTHSLSCSGDHHNNNSNNNSDNDSNSSSSSSSSSSNSDNLESPHERENSLREKIRRSSRIKSRMMAAAARANNRPSHADLDRINRMRAARAVPHQIIQSLKKEIKLPQDDSEYFENTTRPLLTSQQIHWRHFLMVDLSESTKFKGKQQQHGRGHGQGQGHGHDSRAGSSSSSAIFEIDPLAESEFVFHFPAKFWYTRDVEGKPGFLTLMKGLKQEYHVTMELTIDEEHSESDDLIVSVKSLSERELRQVVGRIGDWARAMS